MQRHHHLYNFYQTHRLILQVFVASVTLAIGIVYALGNVYFIPYLGFGFNSNWQVVEVDSNCSKLSTQDSSLQSTQIECTTLASQLQIGDRIDSFRIPSRAVVIENTTDRDASLLAPFNGIHETELIFLTITRNEEQIEIAGTSEQRTLQEQMSRIGISLLFLPFWLAGTIVLLFFRPRNERWYLLIGFNYLTAIWFAIGLVSSSNVFASGLLVAPLSWLMASVYTHFHLVLPEPILPARILKWTKYLHILAFLLAFFTLINLVPYSLYLFGILIGMGGSIALLIARIFRPGSTGNRSATSLMLSGLIIAVLPGLLWILPIMGNNVEAVDASAKLLATLALPILPFFYTYALYKHRLGDTEVRANRALMLYSFAVVYATVFVLLFVLFYREPQFDSAALGAALAASVICQLIAFLSWGPITRLVNRIAYGTTYEPEQLIRHFANAIPRSLSRDQLSTLLETEILSTLLVRQAALFWLAEGQQALVHAMGVERDLSHVTKEDLLEIQKKGKRYLTFENMPEAPFDWARLIVPIEVDKVTIGVWVFGRRDPDDFYPQADIDLATTLGNQIAVALETIRLFEAAQLRAREMERLNLELRRADRLKSDLMRNVTHELRTPLTTIHGFTELMMSDEALTEEHQEYLTAIIHSTQSLVQMVNNVLHMQQQRLASMHEGQRIDLRSIAEQCIERAQILADRDAIWRQQPHEIRLNGPKMSFEVWGEPVQLSYVFDNLLSNAVKFSPNGGLVKVNIWAEQFTFPMRDVDSTFTDKTDTPQPAIVVAVEDHGIGIAPEEVENIWLEFYQADLTETRQFGGTGIGLALVKEIVEQFGGKVWLESTSTQGSTFMFALPAYQEFQPEAIEQLVPPTETKILQQSQAS